MWVKTDSAYINLQHCTKVEPQGGRVRFTLVNGDIVNTTLDSKMQEKLREYLEKETAD